jgi:hypothetical protein
MNKDDIGGHGKVGREESIRPPLHIKNYRYLRRAGNQRGGPSQGRVHELVVQYQIVLKT